MAHTNSHRTNFAVHFASTFGTTPANAAAWAAAEGTSVHRYAVLEAGLDSTLGAALVPNADLQPEVYAVGDHHEGLPGSTSGVKMRVVGTGGSYTDDTQVAQTAQGRLLKHALGGGARGHHTSVASVTSQTVLVLDSGDNIEPGYIIGIEDAGDPGRVFFVQVLEVDGTEITLNNAVPFTVASGDKVIGTEMAWPLADALTDPANAGYTTTNVLVQRGTHTWMRGGCHFELQQLELPRGQQPVWTLGCVSANDKPTGAGAPSAPSWSGTITGTADVQAVGRDTKLFVQEADTTTWRSTCIMSAGLTVGVPVKALESVTEAHDGAPGICGFYTEPADTILEIQVPIDAATIDWQAYWLDQTELVVTYMQVAPVGSGYFVHMHRCKVMGPPVPVIGPINMWTIKLQGSHDTTTTEEALAAKIVIGRS